MSVTPIHSTSAVSAVSPAGSAMTIPFVSTAGNTLVFVSSTQNTAGLSVIDSAGNTWTKVADNAAASATNQKHLVVFVCANAAAVASITWNPGSGAATNLAYSLSEWSPSTVTSSDATLGSTPTLAGDVEIIAAGQYQAPNYTESTGWTQLGYANDGAHGGYALNAAYGGPGNPWTSPPAGIGYAGVGLSAAVTPTVHAHFIKVGTGWVPAVRTIL